MILMLTLIGWMHVLPVVIVQRSIELLQGLNDMSPEEMAGLGIDQRLPDGSSWWSFTFFSSN